jgi:hypothetical protein
LPIAYCLFACRWLELAVWSPPPPGAIEPAGSALRGGKNA